ncbi:MAG: PD-(D/E)XK nuclease family protein, partial [Lutibacter sp.]
TSSLNKEYLYRFFLIFQQILQLNEKHHYIEDLTTYFQFFKQILSSEKLFFKGEPLSGLQIMGMLETRMLDFDNVILTSMNEGIIPKGKQDNSFIPLDIKKYFNLPTYQEKDAVFAYHFNRLLLRTKNCFLIYNSETDGYGAGEKSRFLTQLLLNNPYIKHKVVIPEMEVVTNKPITISKNREILQKIEAYFKKGVSPSAIANYLNNPIQFYEEKILGVYKEQEFEETIALNTFGTVIHETLNELYQPIVGKILSLSEIDFMLNNYERVLKKQYKIIFKKGNVTVGKNRLFYEISKKYISLFLKHEKDNLSKGNQIKILALEKPLEAKLNINNLDFPVKLIGTADRIDLFNQTLRIVDYKTGKVEASHLRISDFEAVKSDSKFSKAMQVMFYAYLYQQKNKKNVNEIESGIISFKNLKAGFIKTNFAPGRQKDFQITNERLNNFEEVIQAILEEIINVKKPFIENLEAKY